MFISMCRPADLEEYFPAPRPAALRIDTTTTFPSLETYLEWCQKNGIEVDPAVVETCLRELIDENR